MPEVGVRPVEEEAVGEVGDGDAEVGVRTARPRVGEGPAAPPHHRDVTEEVGRLEAGPEHDDVGVVARARRSDRPVGADPDDRLVDHRHVGSEERRVPLVGDEDPLAPDRVVGHDGALGERLRDDVRPQLRGEQGGHAPAQPAPFAEGEPPGLHHPVGPPAQGPLGRRHLGQHSSPDALVGAVVLGRHVARRALEDGDRGRLPGERWDELDGARPAADDGDPLAGDVDGVVPARGVPPPAGEALEALEARHVGAVELAAGEDDDRGLERAGRAVGAQHVDVPRAAVLIQVGPDDGGRHQEVVAQAEPLGEGTRVPEDLGLLGVAARPVALGGEREGVKVGRHVAPGARVRVVAPRTADFVRLLDDGEAVEAGPHQLGSHGEPRQAGADDHHRREVAPLLAGPPHRLCQLASSQLQCHRVLPFMTRPFALHRERPSGPGPQVTRCPASARLVGASGWLGERGAVLPSPGPRPVRPRSAASAGPVQVGRWAGPVARSDEVGEWTRPHTTEDPFPPPRWRVRRRLWRAQSQAPAQCRVRTVPSPSSAGSARS